MMHAVGRANGNLITIYGSAHPLHAAMRHDDSWWRVGFSVRLSGDMVTHPDVIRRTWYVHWRYFSDDISAINMFLCNVCGSSFDKKFNFERHLNNVHHIEISVDCNYCGLNLYKSELENHVRSVHQDKKFVCGNCGKKFSSKQVMNQHKCKVSLIQLQCFFVNEMTKTLRALTVLYCREHLGWIKCESLPPKNGLGKSAITCQMSLSISKFNRLLLCL